MFNLSGLCLNFKSILVLLVFYLGFILWRIKSQQYMFSKSLFFLNCFRNINSWTYKRFILEQILFQTFFSTNEQLWRQLCEWIKMRHPTHTHLNEIIYFLILHIYNIHIKKIYLHTILFDLEKFAYRLRIHSRKN